MRFAHRGGLLDPQAQDLLAAVGTDTQREVDRLVADRALVTDLHPQRIEEHQGIDRLERSVLPLGDLVQDGVGHRADQVGRDVDAVELGQVAIGLCPIPRSDVSGADRDLADRHTAGVHRHDLVVKAG